MIYDCAIIGAGPAGIISAIQLKRAGFKVIIFEKYRIGGLLRNANKIENYLGFPEGITGLEFISLLRRQLEEFRITPIITEVLRIRKSETIFEIFIKSGYYLSTTVIIAIGTVPKILDVFIENDLIGERVFYDMTSIYPYIKNTKNKKSIIIIGGGDVAFDYAINLRNQGHNPLLLMRREPSCLEMLLGEVKKKRIFYYSNIKIKRIYKKTKKLIIDCGQKLFFVDFALIAIGRRPAKIPLELNDRNGLFLAGDVRGGKYRQVHIAVGDAMQIAMKVIKYLKNVYKI